MESRRRVIQDIKSVNQPPRTRPYSQSTTPQPPQAAAVNESVRPRSSKSRGKFVYGFLILLLIGSMGLIWKSSLAPATKEVGDLPKAQAIVTEKKLKPIDFASIEVQIKKIIESYPEVQISITYTDIQAATTVKAGVDEPYNAASTTKLLTAVLFLQEIQNGKYSLETPVGGIPAKEQLRKMIEVSDNVSWQAFNSLLTGQALDRFAQDTGLLKYDYRTNVTTPSNIALLLEQLYKNQLLNQENTRLLLSHMQRASESQYIPAALPSGAKVYHKAGYLADRAHDAAIIDNGERPFVLVIFTKSNGNYDFVLGQKIMHEITGAIWPAYTL